MPTHSNFLELANPAIQTLAPYQPGKPIDELAREMAIPYDRIIKLASNENPLGPSPLAMQAITNLESAQLELYPDGACYFLKQQLAKHLNLSPQHLIIGNGSDDVLLMYAKTFVKPNEEILISQYAFQTFNIIAHIVLANCKTVPANDWHHDLEAFAKNISHKTKLIFLANPNNPTGTWFTHEALLWFLEQVPDSVFVVLDEAYFEYMDDPAYPKAISLQQRFPNLLISRTFSKIYGLAGLRVGYGIAHPEIIAIVNRLRLPFNVNTLAQKAAAIALSDKDFVERSLVTNIQGRQQLEDGLSELGLKFISRGGNFVTVEFPNEAIHYYQKLLQQGIIVRPLANMGMPNHLRVTIGSSFQNQQFLNCIIQVL